MISIVGLYLIPQMYTFSSMTTHDWNDVDHTMRKLSHVGGFKYYHPVIKRVLLEHPPFRKMIFLLECPLSSVIDAGGYVPISTT
jgi:hypothetical protein